MINEKMEQAFNDQINKEFYSSYLYLSMAAYLQEIGLTGFASWMRVQVQEETFHATAMLDYLLERGGNVKLEAIPAPPHKWVNVLEVFEETLKHEQQISAWVNDLADVADEQRDRAAATFIQWFIKEQVEEEATASDILAKLKLINLNGDALFSMDKDLSTRTFVQPVIN